MESLSFVLVTDKNYIKQTCVTIVSVLSHLKNPANSVFYIFAIGFSKLPHPFRKIKEQYNSHIIILDMSKYDNYFLGQNSNNFNNKYVTISTYYRLLIFAILPDYVKKIIYLDSDIIVNTDLSTLYNLFPENYYLGAVAELNDIKHKKRDHGHLFDISDFKNWIKDNEAFPYFNAGFFIANIDKCKQSNVFEQILEFLQRYPNPRFADQDALNAILGQKYHNKILFLDVAYNVCCDLDFSEYVVDPKHYYYSKKSLLNALLHPKILHFDGPNKPWKNMKNPNFYYNWWYYAKKSGIKFRQRKNNFFIEAFQLRLKRIAKRILK